MLRLALAIGAFAHSALASIYDTRFNGTSWDDDAWRITTTNLDQGHFQSRMSLANGYLGINLAALGPFFDIDVPVNGDDIQGWPLFDRRQSFATIAGFWDSQPTTNGSNFLWLNQYGGESVISGVPHWGGLHVQVGDILLNASTDASQISNFTSTLDIRKGALYWNYTWTPQMNTSIEVAYAMFVNKLRVNQAAVQVQLTAKQDVNATIIDLLDGNCAVRTSFVDKGYFPEWDLIWTAVQPSGVRNVTAYLTSALVGDDSCDYSSRGLVQNVPGAGNQSTIAQSIAVALKAGRKSTITKYVGGASSDAFDEPKFTALNGSWYGAGAGFDASLEEHAAEWASIMRNDTVDSFHYTNGSLPDDAMVQELQITSITNPFQLLQNTVGENAVLAAGNNSQLQVNTISVCGLGSSCYAGLVFWDVEVWMQPGLVVAYPDAAKQIARYRVERFGQAQANVGTAFTSSENQTGKFSEGNTAVFPWTSGRYGNCTGTGPCFDYEYHINGDIGLEFYNYWTVTGDDEFFKTQLFPIYEAIGQFYAELVDYNQTTGLYELLNATDPDEYANFKNNVGYTMVLMASHLNTTNDIRARYGMEPNATWTNISSHMTIPVNNDANIILEYSTQNGSIVVKQADIVLIDDFLQFPNPYTLSDLDYYASAQSPDGPAMTYGVFSVVANRESPTGCSSYTYDLYGSLPYTRGPWFQFSEQLIDDASINGGTHPAFPFLTGVGGANRVTVFGFLGLRLNPDTLDIDPSLPPQIPQLEYRTIYWNGWPIKAFSNQTHTTLWRLNTSLPNANSTFANTSIPVTISLTGTDTLHLSPNGANVTVSNRQISQNKTIPGNIAQCQPVSSTQSYEPGQFPLSAVDGSISTKWQPSQSNMTSSLTVSLPEPFVPITEISFDWAQAPPTSYSVTFHNLSDTSSVPPVNVTASNNVSISNPFDAATQYVIRPYMSNTTNVTLSRAVWSARYATLSIEGNQANVGTENEKNGTGATVAEWALVASDGSDVMQRRGVEVL